MKWLEEVHQPERITVTTAVHIPLLSGYWSQSLEVLKLCLQSMRENTRQPFDLMVLDNRSCVEVRNYLLDLYGQDRIQYLILSDSNLGKVGAWNLLFLSAPGEIISYADSDVYFLEDWLGASLQVLGVFPEAGMVTAQPIAGGDISGLWTTQAAQKDPSIQMQIGHLIPDAYLIAHLKGLGVPQQEYDCRHKDRKDVLLSRGTAQAYATASHFQFTTTRQAVSALFPSRTMVPLGDDDQFDIKMRELGFWRLSTIEYLVHHMGNFVPDFIEELPWVNTTQALQGKAEQSPSISDRSRLLGNRFVRHFLKRVNSLSYRLLYGDLE
jgi:glycosyltransferase involved in cell wall biosynthesis